MADGGFGPVKTGGGGARASPYDRPPGEPDEQQILAALGMAPGGEVCQFFVKAGWCKFGDACRYAHVGEPRQREMCEFFVKAGWCKWGDQCKHLHAGGPADPGGGPQPAGGGLLEQLLGDGGQPVGGQPPPAGGGGWPPGQEVCQFFTKAGWCKWGSACRFVHAGPPSPAPGCGAYGGLLPPMGGKGGGKFNEACQFFQKAGWCRYGDTCRYIHSGGPAAGAARPPQTSSPLGSPRATFAEACEFFSKAGWCKWGDGCRYVHSGAPAIAGAAGRAAAPMPGGPLGRSQQVLLTGQTMVCKYFNTPGGCRNGEMCTFSHVGAPGAKEACQFFTKAGWCKWGDQCKYIHTGGPPGGPKGMPPGMAGGGAIGGGLDAAPPPVSELQGLPPGMAGGLGGCIGGGFGAAPPPVGELQATPPMNGMQPEVCQFFQKSGWCKWGDQCKYVHTGGPPSAVSGPSAGDAALLAAVGAGLEAR